jgi:hypothetical protein
VPFIDCDTELPRGVGESRNERLPSADHIANDIGLDRPSNAFVDERGRETAGVGLEGRDECECADEFCRAG